MPGNRMPCLPSPIRPILSVSTRCCAICLLPGLVTKRPCWQHAFSTNTSLLLSVGRAAKRPSAAAGPPPSPLRPPMRSRSRFPAVWLIHDPEPTFVLRPIQREWLFVRPWTSPISTNPKPRDRPVYRSEMTLAELTVPCCAKQLLELLIRRRIGRLPNKAWFPR